MAATPASTTAGKRYENRASARIARMKPLPGFTAGGVSGGKRENRAGRKISARNAHARDPKLAAMANSRVCGMSVTMRLRKPTSVVRKAIAIGLATFRPASAMRAPAPCGDARSRRNSLAV